MWCMGGSAIDLATMAGVHHLDRQIAPLPFVNHAVVTHTQAPQSFEFTLEGRACGWGVAELVDGCDERISVTLRLLIKAESRLCRKSTKASEPTSLRYHFARALVSR